MARTFELNEIAFTEFILSIDVKASYGKIALNIGKQCRRKNYPDVNAVAVW
jgi:hypothetical protein